MPFVMPVTNNFNGKSTKPCFKLINKVVFSYSHLISFQILFVSENAISHLASADHLKNLKSFMWKHGGGMDRIDGFRISEADIAKVVLF